MKRIVSIIENPIIQLAIGFTVVAFVCYKCGAITLSSGKQSHEIEMTRESRLVSNAYDAAKIEMKLNLKSPSTAEFASPYNEGVKCKINDDKSIIIQSFVDSQNSFGATMRTNFRCTVSQNGHVSDLITW